MPAPCGYCLKASMTDPATLWIPAYAGMTVNDTGKDSMTMGGVDAGLGTDASHRHSMLASESTG